MSDKKKPGKLGNKRERENHTPSPEANTKMINMGENSKIDELIRSVNSMTSEFGRMSSKVQDLERGPYYIVGEQHRRLEQGARGAYQ